MYKLWSAFTKNIRYMIDCKGKAVTLQRFGTFTRSQLDPCMVAFIPSSELASALSAERGSASSVGETAGPEWAKIAPAASITS